MADSLTPLLQIGKADSWGIYWPIASLGLLTRLQLSATVAKSVAAAS